MGNNCREARLAWGVGGCVRYLLRGVEVASSCGEYHRWLARLRWWASILDPPLPARDTEVIPVFVFDKLASFARFPSRVAHTIGGRRQFDLGDHVLDLALVGRETRFPVVPRGVLKGPRRTSCAHSASGARVAGHVICFVVLGITRPEVDVPHIVCSFVGLQSASYECCGRGHW